MCIASPILVTGSVNGSQNVYCVSDYCQRLWHMYSWTKCFISFIFTTERVFYNSHLYLLYIGSLLQLCSFCFTASIFHVFSEAYCQRLWHMYSGIRSRVLLTGCKMTLVYSVWRLPVWTYTHCSDFGLKTLERASDLKMLISFPFFVCLSFLMSET
jgi:hypothetical protein